MFEYAVHRTGCEVIGQKPGSLLDPAVFFMSLFGSHYLIDDNGLITRIKEYRVTVGYVHPVPFFWRVEPFYIAVCVRMIGEPVNMFTYNPAILVRKVC